MLSIKHNKTQIQVSGVELCFNFQINIRHYKQKEDILAIKENKQTNLVFHLTYY